MTDPLQLAEHTWKDAEALVERVEQAARCNVPTDSFFADLTSGLRLTTGASSVAIWVAEHQQRTLLSRSGIAVHDEQTVQLDLGRDFAAESQWADGPNLEGRLLAVQRVHPMVQLGLDLRFDRPIDISLRRPLSELVEVILDLAATVYLRSQLASLRRRLDHQTDRDGLIRKLSDGIGLTDSCASIASAIASETLVDRVTLLRPRSSRYRLVSTSTQSKIDRRARQVRLLEQLTETALQQHGSFSFTVGEPGDVNEEVREVLDEYLHQSGCREIHLESIDDEQSETIAAIVLERFRLPADQHRPITSLLTPLRQPVRHAVRTALDRDDAGWGWIASRLASKTRQRKTLFAAIGLSLIVVASCLIPATLEIPVEGRIVAAHRSSMFAPRQGIVAKVPVHNGQQVRQGEPLVIMRSPSLQLQQRNIEGALSTAQARLNSLLAVRSRDRGPASRQREPNASAEEQVLKTEIDGLEQQLQLLQEQHAGLTITSPIDGRVDCWDLQQSLTARPVTHGQLLLDVVSSAQGWIVQLDLPEKNVNYVLDQQRREACRFSFRLRSDPTRTRDGAIDEVAEVAHLNPQGQSLVRLTSRLASAAGDEFRAGATVTAQIHCGQYPLGYVWLRGLIQWARTQAWL